ncbi:MAG: metal ABC transporter ATP-binding protein [Anaerolineales bacterium]|nr:metal ABC transporter ATP-binding protein [Anaerolineales bacterium]
MVESLLELGRRIFKGHQHTHLAGEPLLTVQDVTVKYEQGVGLEQISFDLQGGENVAVVGPNGAGKSTLFKVIAGVIKHQKGQVKVSGVEPGGHVCISYVPQRSQVDWNFPVTVADVVMMGRISKLGPFRIPQPRDWKQVRQALETVGLDALGKRQISELSGGQQQRMFIARALVQEAELMLMDEPLRGLDVPSLESVLAALNMLQEKGVTIMVAMHDLKLAAEQFDQIMLINKRLFAFGTPEEVLQAELLRQAYGSRVHVVAEGTQTLAVDDGCCEGDHHGMA